ncbi:hypothetical protein S101384_04350 [Bacillus subtilis subsp. subtilis]|nr:hypothetical protein S101384_04350 [Bacillus subtilis subsp. subtilis]
MTIKPTYEIPVRNTALVNIPVAKLAFATLVVGDSIAEQRKHQLSERLKSTNQPRQQLSLFSTKHPRHKVELENVRIKEGHPVQLCRCAMA